MFVRVVQREAWEVEVPGKATRSFASEREAMAFARSLMPAWVEVGVVVPAREGVPRHHRWTTLRRSQAGSYVVSGLRWGGRPTPGG
ncbi:MAG TPA: hypothetical protein VFD01_15365 [Candidatus Dormibacteraeota bacterium]|nr:hypothetical protein [Candidatus Dormibacteraeota bacterium]